MLEFIAETTSTNADFAARLRAAVHVPEGHWLITGRQTQGRGRLGRQWHDGLGNYMGSTLVHLGHGDPAPGTLALVAGLALFEVVMPMLTADQGLMLKWPNDLLVERAKLAGILLERERDAVIIGIGVNLVSAPRLPDRKAISLSELGSNVARDTFAEALARQFDIELARWRSFGLSPIINRWLSAAHPVGTPLTINCEAVLSLSGTFAGLTDDGALQLRAADGTTHLINAGEVSLA